MHVQLGQIMNNKMQKGQKPTVTSEVPGARVLRMIPARSTTKGVGRPPKPRSWPHREIRPYTHLI